MSFERITEVETPLDAAEITLGNDRPQTKVDLGVKEVAAPWGVTEAVGRIRIAKKRLPACGGDRRWSFHPDDVDECRPSDSAALWEGCESPAGSGA